MQKETHFSVVCVHKVSKSYSLLPHSLLTAEEEMIDQISLRCPRFLVYFWSGTNNRPVMVIRTTLFQLQSPSLINMTCRYIHKAVKEQLVVMSGHLKSSNISKATGISHRTVNRVIKLQQATGSVVHKPLVIGPGLSRRPARSRYSRLTHKRRASYGHALGLLDWRLVI